MSIGKLFRTNPKMLLFHKAYLFSEVNLAFKELFNTKYCKISQDFEALDIKVRDKENQVTAVVSCSNINLLTTLKIETNFIQNFLNNYLIQKEVVGENSTFKVYFVSN